MKLAFCVEGTLAAAGGGAFRFVLQVMTRVRAEGHFLIRFEAKLLVFRPPTPSYVLCFLCPFFYI